jgi:hypothetical protein
MYLRYTIGLLVVHVAPRDPSRRFAFALILKLQLAGKSGFGGTLSVSVPEMRPVVDPMLNPQVCVKLEN